MLEALTSLTNPSLISLRIAVAYTTYGGVTALMPQLRRQATPVVWERATKILITCFDMGNTDPAAIRYLVERHAFSIRVSDVKESNANYHPKIYVIGRKDDTGVLLGSANLSGRALAANSEIGVLYDPYPDLTDLEKAWSAILETSHPLTAKELKKYEAERPKRQRRKPQPDAPVPAEFLPAAGELPVFAKKVDAGMDPMAYDAFWVEAGLVSGWAQSQVELPRSANRFFGSKFDGYNTKVVTPIAEIDLLVGPNTWKRPLRWHGDNRMERFNLPTPNQSGLQYSGHVVLFRRAPAGFTVEAAEDGTALATSWIQASRQLSTLCRVGEKTVRRCGLLEPKS
jgi:HKD family nuclease